MIPEVRVPVHQRPFIPRLSWTIANHLPTPLHSSASERDRHRHAERPRPQQVTLPTRIHWPGTIANTLLYGLAAAIPLLVILFT